jgi:uncharacterized damage-inducible protein DinB
MRCDKDFSDGKSTMRLAFVAIMLSLSLPAVAQSKTPGTLKSILLEQLQTTHNKKDWFVPANTAVEGLTAEQAKWTDGKGNHSIGQLTVHITFWDKEALARFKGEPKVKFSGDNNETFNSFDSKNWPEAVKQLDEVMTGWERAVEAADDKKIALWASTIAHVGAHNAYHVGQIIYIRKLQGSWDSEKGVK